MLSFSFTLILIEMISLDPVNRSQALFIPSFPVLFYLFAQFSFICCIVIISVELFPVRSKLVRKTFSNYLIFLSFETGVKVLFAPAISSWIYASLIFYVSRGISIRRTNGEDGINN